MKYTLLIAAISVAFSSCSSTTSTVGNLSDSARYENRDNALTVHMRPEGSARVRFTVINETDSVQSFLKWHTPFEPLISKYLDVYDSDGKEVSYMGAMARRRMPPLQTEYITVSPGDSTSVLVNLREGYDISRPGNYRISYNGSGISKLMVRDTIQVRYP